MVANLPLNAEVIKRLQNLRCHGIYRIDHLNIWMHAKNRGLVCKFCAGSRYKNKMLRFQILSFEEF